MDEKPPRNLKAMLSEAKDASELMVDLGYAALFFDNVAMAEEVMELEERLDGLVHEMREVCILAARSPHDAEQMSSVLHVISSIERIGNAAVDIARIVIHRLGLDPDNHGIPIVTSSLDFLGAVSLILAIVILGLS